ncbi:MAG: recombinase family protein [Clostridiales bacterium]|nr:recombinase family protein [Clostridiales bacterium]
MELAKNVQFIPARPKREVTPVAIYCKVSTADAAQLDSLSNQVSALTSYVSNFDEWKLVDVYVEVSSSKKVSSHKQFGRMIRGCKSGKLNSL